MNETIEKFLKQNNLDIDAININMFRIRSDSEINPILNRFYIPGKKEQKEVSIAEICGYSYEYYELSNNLLDNLSYFYNENGSGYQTRSIGFLKYDADQLLELLKEVCKKDTMCLRECEHNKYVITDNGLHRYNILRFHFLNELSKVGQDIQAYKALKKKYTVQVSVQKTDYIKTYSYSILRKIFPTIQIQAEYDKDYNITGNSVVTINGDKTKVFNDAKLIELVKWAVENNKEIIDRYIDMFEFYDENLISFHEFLTQNNINLLSNGVNYE